MFSESFILFIASFFAGLLGSMSGLGGGLIIVPLLLYGFDVPLLYAVGASLLSVIATSIATTATLLPRKLTHIHLGIFLETGSVLGAIFGATIAALVPTKAIALIFSFVLFYSAYQGFRGPPLPKVFKPGYKSPIDFSYVYEGQKMEVHHPFLGWFLMMMGGILSGLLGIGSGVFNVVIFERLMGLPLIIATATSSSIIGMTAAASGWVYWEKGYMNPHLITAIIPAILLGSFVGAYLLKYVSKHFIRILFSGFVLLMGLRMLWGALS